MVKAYPHTKKNKSYKNLKLSEPWSTLRLQGLKQGLHEALRLQTASRSREFMKHQGFVMSLKAGPHEALWTTFWLQTNPHHHMSDHFLSLPRAIILPAYFQILCTAMIFKNLPFKTISYSTRVLYSAGIAHLVEQRTIMRQGPGSIPTHNSTWLGVDSALHPSVGR